MHHAWKMPGFPRCKQIIIGIVLLTLFAGAGAGWWLCQKSDFLAFLPVRTGAQWIIDAAPPEIVAHPNRPVNHVFQRRFALSAPLTNAVLTVCVFKHANVEINGHKVPGIENNHGNWKSPKTADVTSLLRAGTNKITVWVTNAAGPPALWLRLQSGRFSLSTDNRWQVSLTGEFWNPAHPAAQPVPIPRWSAIYDGTSTIDAIKTEWRTLVLFLAIALGIVLVGKRTFSAGTNFKFPVPPIYLLLGVVLIARVVLFVNEAPRLPGWVSFDEPAHLTYIHYIEENGKLPPPDSGSEMHQPPLHYLVSAAVAKLCGVSPEGTDATVALRAVNGVFGLLYCWLALLCLRQLFPNNFSAQAAGLLLAAFLPPQLYLSVGITNDPLAALCVTAAFYFLLRILRSEGEDLRLYAALGLSLGAALLSKLSALPAVPVFFFVLALRLIQKRKYSPHDWLRSLGTVALLCLATSDWQFLRATHHTGAIIAIPHSADNSWRQFPGFRTASFYLHFGHVLARPFFAGLDSFADGIYSTLWGDGMLSGATKFIFRPPWNYDLMKAGYLLGLPLSLLALAGIGIGLRKAIRDRGLEWFAIVATALIYLLALIALTLLGPWQSQVKAFYAMPAFVPFCALILAGWNWLAQKNPAWRISLWILVLLWSLTAFASFWISNHRAETWRSRAVMAMRQKNFQTAVTDATTSLSMNPNDFDTRVLLATALRSQNKNAEAIRQYLAAMQINPDSPKILNLFAITLLGEGNGAVPHAVHLAEHACELTGYRNDEMLATLASAYAKGGDLSQAMTTAKAAETLASQNGDAGLAKRNRELIERCHTLKTKK